MARELCEVLRERANKLLAMSSGTVGQTAEVTGRLDEMREHARLLLDAVTAVTRLRAELDAALAERDALRVELVRKEDENTSLDATLAVVGSLATAAEARAERAEAFVREYLDTGYGKGAPRSLDHLDSLAVAILAPEAQRPEEP